jgi:hypothetical protein
VHGQQPAFGSTASPVTCRGASGFLQHASEGGLSVENNRTAFLRICRLLPEWLNVAAYPDSVHSVLTQMPTANLNVLRMLLELCSFINTQSAANEMDALALAEVLAPCVAWRPAPKPQPAPGGVSRKPTWSEAISTEISLSMQKPTHMARRIRHSIVIEKSICCLLFSTHMRSCLRVCTQLLFSVACPQ